MLDERLLRVTIDVHGEKHVFETLAINAIGSKNTTALQNNAEVRIANIGKEVRDQLLTEGTPFAILAGLENSILIEAGRESSGLVQVYQGDIITVNVSQPPDITLVMRALTSQRKKLDIAATSQSASAKFSLIAQQVADGLGVNLEFDTVDKNVSNFSFSGAAAKLVDSLAAISYGVDAFLDDNRLVIKPRGSTTPYPLTEINIDTGLIGIPEFLDVGIRCTVLVNQNVKLGDDINLTSEAYPAVNGRYQVYRILFNLANRDVPFYYTIEASRKDRRPLG